MTETATDSAARREQQQQGIRNTIIWLIAFIAMILGLLISSHMRDRGMTEEQMESLGFYLYDEPRALRDFSLVDQDGEPASLSVFQGQWNMVFFGFTFCPDICPTTMAVLNQAVQQLESPPRVVMVSVDPERDTPEALKHYVPSFNPSFIGLTGEFDDIVGLATQVNAAFGKVPGPDPGTYLVDHSASIVLIDPQGRYAGFVKAPHRPNNLVAIANALD